ncbi:MAG: hypothetical protein PHD81_00470 [Candidatus Nanoarchaeia archaeon]|nr:hypothetical protein [Candidatus Nanoarchaeia archaeon]MDD5587563.1 hypothetical protein [Candidatus Nanoarchaeia archaeon]
MPNPTLEQRIGLGTPEFSLKENLFSMGSIYAIDRELQEPQTDEKLIDLYDKLAKAMSDNDKPTYKQLIKEFEMHPVTATKKAKENFGERARLLKPIYEANKEAVIKEVIDQITAEIKDEDYVKATFKVAGYFQNLFKPTKLDQKTADEYASEESAANIGVSSMYSVTGNIEEYTPRHKALQAKAFASKYFDIIEQEKDGTVTKYKFNEEKFKKAMEDVIAGSIIYKNAKTIQIRQAQEAQEQAQH